MGPMIPPLLMAALAAQPPQTIPASSTPEVVVRRAGLANTFVALRRGQPLTIAYLGGSITAGAGASDAGKTSYRALVTRWFRETYPKADVREVNAAIGGTPSDLGAFRLGRDVLARKPDLLFVEFAVNDGGLPDDLINRAMEGIVRQVRRDNRRTDICFLYALAKDHLPDFAANRLPRTHRLHEGVAAHYGIPAVNMALAAAQRINAGRMPWDEFAKDAVHPTDAGYRIYADAVTGWLAQENTRGYEGHPQTRRTAHALPAPLFAGNFENAAMLDFSDTKSSSGWRRENKKWAGQFDHIAVADTPGATLALEFTGTVLGIFYVLGPDSGAFEYRVDGGAWKKCDPFDQWARGGYRAHSRLLETDLKPGRHRLELRTLAEHHPDSRGTTTRLGYLLADGRTK